MKFLSNFDTNLEHEVYSKYVWLYGKENVFVIHRAKIFWILYCVFPVLIIWIILLILGFFMWLDSWDTSLDNLKSVLMGILMLIVVVVWWWKVFKRYLDYKMDFCIVTIQEIASYNQTWLLTRTSRTIDADKIKTVSVSNTSGLFKSIFNYGDLIFLSEGDQAGGWDIHLNFVHDVNHTKNKVRSLIEPHLQHQKTFSNEIQEHSS